MIELINWADNKNKDQNKKQWAINCELHQQEEIEEMERKIKKLTL